MVCRVSSGERRASSLRTNPKQMSAPHASRRRFLVLIIAFSGASIHRYHGVVLCRCVRAVPVGRSVQRPNPLTGLTDLGHSYESWPEPCMMCVVEINIAEGINGTFTDTFDIISDTPEPAAFLLVGSALMLLGLRLRRR